MKTFSFIFLTLSSPSYGLINDCIQPQRCRAITLSMADQRQPPPPNNGATDPTTFRGAEVLGLRLMQEEKFEEALAVFKEGLKLPGSKSDIIRTKLLNGPSPVGGSMGGFGSDVVQQLDEFELQAAHYNMACAYSQLKDIDMAVASLQKSFENGFDNYATVRGDPDLKPLKGTQEFDDLMGKWDRFKPFGGFFEKK